MAPIEFYPDIRLVHIGLVATSGALFAVRGAAVLASHAWAMRKPWRIASYVIDTLLLTAGVTLWTLLALNPVRDAWLGTKLLLLLVYIGLGSFALKRGRTPAVRRVSYAAALATYAFMAGVALRHHPAGPLAGLLQP